jgi:hypothetical protein
MDPSTFLDAVLGYAFYKLSVVSSQVRKQGYSNDIIARIKFGKYISPIYLARPCMPVTAITDFSVLSIGLVLIWAVKDFHRALPLEYITYV